MKRLILVLTVIILGSLLVSAQSSVADAARQAKAEKKPVPAKHVYTNDDIVILSAPSVEKAPATGGDATAASGDLTKESQDKSAEKKDSKEEAAAKAAKAAALKQKIADQQKAIADQERELNIMEREHQIRVAEYYADAGTQLRSGEKWFQDEKKYQESLDAKKKALSDAKTVLDGLNEQARKSGVRAE